MILTLAYDILFLRINPIENAPDSVFPVLTNPAIVSRSRIYASGEFGLYLFSTKFFSGYVQYGLVNNRLNVYAGGVFRTLPAFDVVDPDTGESITFSYSDGYFLGGASYSPREFVRVGGNVALVFMSNSLESALYPAFSIGAEFSNGVFRGGFSLKNLIPGQWDALTISGDIMALLYGDKEKKWELYSSLVGMYSGYTGVLLSPSALVEYRAFRLGVTTTFGSVAEKVSVTAFYRIPYGVSVGYSFGYSSIGQLLHRVFVYYQVR